MIYITTLLLGLIDFIGYSFWNEFIKGRVWIYHTIQHIFFILVWYLVYEIYGTTTVIALLILHFTWCTDLAYYLWHWAWNERNAFKEEVMGNIVTWGWWSFYGWFRWLPNCCSRGSFSANRYYPISGEILVKQAIVGVLVTLVMEVI